MCISVVPQFGLVACDEPFIALSRVVLTVVVRVRLGSFWLEKDEGRSSVFYYGSLMCPSLLGPFLLLLLLDPWGFISVLLLSVMFVECNKVLRSFGSVWPLLLWRINSQILYNWSLLFIVFLFNWSLLCIAFCVEIFCKCTVPFPHQLLCHQSLGLTRLKTCHDI